jgi:hypothetical protein
VHYETKVDVSWLCEYCCANGGAVKPTSIDLLATADFRLEDSFTDTTPGKPNDPEAPTKQGLCIDACWKKHRPDKTGRWDRYEFCRQGCRQQWPTDDTMGDPYGISGNWTETMTRTKRGSCDMPLVTTEDPSWEK